MDAQSRRALLQAVQRFADVRVLVVGDIIVDHFIHGSVSRISPEAPVPVVNVTSEKLLLGGGANVLNNVFALGGRGSICGLIGNDAMGDHLVAMLAAKGVDTVGLIRSDRPTTVKTRVIAHHQQVVRFDREKTAEPTAERIRQMLAFVDGCMDRCDVVIVSDYFKGVISAPFMAAFREKVVGRGIPVIVDPKPFDPERFHGVTLITPNHHEAERMSGIAITDDKSLLVAAQRLRQLVQCRAVLVTRGEAGMSLLEDDDRLLHIPTAAREVFDVTGAGDTVAATLAMALAAGLSVGDAAVLANAAAGIVVAKVGTATPSPAELLAMLDGGEGGE